MFLQFILLCLSLIFVIFYLSSLVLVDLVYIFYGFSLLSVPLVVGYTYYNTVFYEFSVLSVIFAGGRCCSWWFFTFFSVSDFSIIIFSASIVLGWFLQYLILRLLLLYIFFHFLFKKSCVTVASLHQTSMLLLYFLWHWNWLWIILLSGFLCF